MNGFDLSQENAPAIVAFEFMCICGNFLYWFINWCTIARLDVIFFYNSPLNNEKCWKSSAKRNESKLKCLCSKYRRFPSRCFFLRYVESAVCVCEWIFPLLAYTHNWLFILEIKSVWQGLIALFCNSNSSENGYEQKSSDLKKGKIHWPWCPWNGIFLIVS